jgi:hypothetical protein
MELKAVDFNWLNRQQGIKYAMILPRPIEKVCDPAGNDESGGRLASQQPAVGFHGSLSIPRRAICSPNGCH